jgi:ATP-dependent RNA helicase DDX60
MSDDEHDLAESAMDVQDDEVINAWYATCRPLFIDLVGDYAGRELFLLEGDSMLRECFSDDRIDFQNGFQMLHAVYVVERFLENLIKRHCRFQIVFFDEHAPLCMPGEVTEHIRPRYILARSIIIRHIELRLPKSLGVEVLRFDSLYSHVFAQHLVASPVHFVMAHDGFLPLEGKVGKETTEQSQQAKAMLRKGIFWFHTHRLNVALINQIEFRDSKVSTLLVHVSNLFNPWT